MYIIEKPFMRIFIIYIKIVIATFSKDKFHHRTNDKTPLSQPPSRKIRSNRSLEKFGAHQPESTMACTFGIQLRAYGRETFKLINVEVRLRLYRRWLSRFPPVWIIYLGRSVWRPSPQQLICIDCNVNCFVPIARLGGGCGSRHKFSHRKIAGDPN